MCPTDAPPNRGPRPRRRRRRSRPEDRRAASQPTALVPEVSRLAQPAPPSDTLRAEEVAEMKEHLAFLRRYKSLLRLKLNAAEDLLVNGQRDPTERGVCRHLLGKVDRAVIEAAIARDPLHSDAGARARMLAGAVRLTADVGILLAYLEALAHVSSRAEAAQAFAEVVHRMDFESLSPARLARLLQVLVDTFVDHERVQVLFSLLANPAFRRALDGAGDALAPAVAQALAPLRALHHRVVERGAEPPALLTPGMQLVLSAPDPVLRGYAEPLREAMLELALAPDVPPGLADRAAGVLLSSLPRTGRPYARLALRRAAQLLHRHADDRARAVLQELRRAQPSVRAAERWLAALDGRRLGRIALAGEPPERGRLIRAFWLDGQRPAWVRTAAAPAAERLACEARLQRELALPGIAAIVEHGVATGIPYVAVLGSGQPLDAAVARPLAATFTLAAEAGRVLRALALAAIVLPDAAAERFLCAPPVGLALADLDGAQAGDADRAHAAHAVDLARSLLPANAAARLPLEVGDALERAFAAPPRLVELIDIFDRAALFVPREGS
jgi:hypothetical protein